MLNVSWVQYPITRSKQAIYPSVLLFTEQYQTAQALSTKQHNMIWRGIFRARCLVHRQYVKKNRASFGCQGFHEKCSVSGPPIYQKVDKSCILKLVSKNRNRWDTTLLDALIKWLMFSRYCHLLSDIASDCLNSAKYYKVLQII